MLLTTLAVVVSAALLTILASIIITWSSNRSAAWNMAFAIVLAFAAIALLGLIAAIVSWFSARAVFRPQ